jgi:hypothetical protein
MSIICASCLVYTKVEDASCFVHELHAQNTIALSGSNCRVSGNNQLACTSSWRKSKSIREFWLERPLSDQITPELAKPIALIFGARAAGAAVVRSITRKLAFEWPQGGRVVESRGDGGGGDRCAVGVRSIRPRHPSDWPTDRANWFITPSAISVSARWPAFSIYLSLTHLVARNYFHQPQAHIARSLAHYSFYYALTPAHSASSIHSTAGCNFFLHTNWELHVNLLVLNLNCFDVICARRHQFIILWCFLVQCFCICIYLLAIML